VDIGIKVPHYAIFRILGYLLPLGPDVFLSSLFSNTLSHFLLSEWETKLQTSTKQEDKLHWTKNFKTFFVFVMNMLLI